MKNLTEGLAANLVKAWVDRMPARLPEGMLNCAIIQVDAMQAEIDEYRDYVASLNAELAAIKQAKPVAIVKQSAIFDALTIVEYEDAASLLTVGAELFLAAGAQERKQLTDDEIIEIRKSTAPSQLTWGYTLAFARAIEAKLKEQS